MEEYSKKKDKKAFTRDAIIGLGEDSFKKNYYPELQEKIMHLEHINSRNEALISTIPDILMVSNSAGEIEPLYSSAKKPESPMAHMIYAPETMEILRSIVRETTKNGCSGTREFQLVKDNMVSYYEVRLHKSETNEYLMMIRNMTDRITLERQLIELVEKDTLTKLYNRRSFEDRMNLFKGRTCQSLSMVSIDVNGLKFINDTLGHLAGDRMIVAAADIILEVFGEHGHVARIGGDEFGVILENMEESQVEGLMVKLNAKVEEYNASSKNEALSLAYGYSYHKTGKVNMELMFQEADNNMYQSKLLKKESIRSAFVSTFMKALEAKDYIVEGHVTRMEELSLSIGEALSLHQDRLDRLLLLTKFHDIGKIGIPDSILKKPAPLTDAEWKVMRTHSSIGERIALEAADIKDIAHLILKHHERWDGKGYPLGLQGEDIPIECRILAIADAYDAMTNDRPYRKALPCHQAMEEIERSSETQFDPKLVLAFLSLMKKRC